MAGSDVVGKSYPLAALLIYAAKQEVTPEKIQAVFESVGLEYSPKIASMFALPAERYGAMLSSVGSAPAAAAATPAAQSSAAPAQKEESADSESGDFEIDF